MTCLSAACVTPLRHPLPGVHVVEPVGNGLSACHCAGGVVRGCVVARFCFCFNGFVLLMGWGDFLAAAGLCPSRYNSSIVGGCVWAPAPSRFARVGVAFCGFRGQAQAQAAFCWVSSICSRVRWCVCYVFCWNLAFIDGMRNFVVVTPVNFADVVYGVLRLLPPALLLL